MTKQTDNARKRPRNNRAGRTPLPAATVWQIFFVLLLIWSALAAVLWLLGFDFTAERGHRKLWVCGFVRFLLPDRIGHAIPCVWWNLAPFYAIPALALFHAVKKTLIRS